MAVVTSALACAALAAPGAGAATFEDDFAARETAKGLPAVVSGSNVGAGREAGEPALKPLAPAGHTVWVEWEAENSGYVTLSTCESSIATVLGVYTGTQVDQLSEVESVANYQPSFCSGLYNGVTFLATAGDRYEIALDGNAFVPPMAPPPVTEGALSLALEAAPVPPNDAFATPTSVVGRTSEEPGGARFYFASQRGYNWGAGKEPGEPDHAGDPGGASVWFSWTAPESLDITASICCSDADLIAVYMGDGLGSLSPVAAGRGKAEFEAVAGTTYRVAVDGAAGPLPAGPQQDSFELVIQMTPPPFVEEWLPRIPPPPAATEPAPLRAPRTKLVEARVKQKSHTATFEFVSLPAVNAFHCRLDGKPWSPCASPRRYANLRPGAHAFRAYAIDAAGVRDASPLVSHFSIRPDRRALR